MGTKSCEIDKNCQCCQKCRTKGDLSKDSTDELGKHPNAPHIGVENFILKLLPNRYRGAVSSLLGDFFC